MGERETLKKAILSTLEMAENYNLQSVAIPAISSGIFGYPKDLCAKDIFEAIEIYASKMKPDSNLRLIRITILDDETISPFMLEFIERYKLDGDRFYKGE